MKEHFMKYKHLIDSSKILLECRVIVNCVARCKAIFKKMQNIFGFKLGEL